MGIFALADAALFCASTPYELSAGLGHGRTCGPQWSPWRSSSHRYPDEKWGISGLSLVTHILTWRMDLLKCSIEASRVVGSLSMERCSYFSASMTCTINLISPSSWSHREKNLGSIYSTLIWRHCMLHSLLYLWGSWTSFIAKGTQIDPTYLRFRSKIKITFSGFALLDWLSTASHFLSWLSLRLPFR